LTIVFRAFAPTSGRSTARAIRSEITPAIDSKSRAIAVTPDATVPAAAARKHR
jgi:hypothetical protein